MPNKFAIAEEWQDWLAGQGIDFGEPICWACQDPLRPKGWKASHSVKGGGE